MKTIKILGPGCYNCQALEKNTKEAIEELGLENTKIEHVKEIEKIIEYGIMSTPGIVINGKVMANGRIPEVDEIKNWLS